MKKILIAISVLMLLFSCSKDDSNTIRELDITYHEMDKGLNDPLQETYLYPNPFTDKVNFHINGAAKGSILISDDKGGMKQFEFNNYQFELKFGDVEFGAYYCEISYNDKIFRTHLIKVK